MNHLIGCTLALALLAGVPASADHHEEEAAPVMDPAMQAWMDAMNPGPQHEMLAGMAGSWNAELTLWMTPGAEAMQTTGTIAAEMIFDGRILREAHSGSMMGMVFEGLAFTGYDNITGEFWGVWMDNTGTGVYPSQGSYDEESGKLTLEGEWAGPEGPMQVKMVGWMEGSDTRRFEMWTTTGGETYQSMAATYTRATD
jgi:hypothetical protein